MLKNTNNTENTTNAIKTSNNRELMTLMIKLELLYRISKITIITRKLERGLGENNGNL